VAASLAVILGWRRKPVKFSDCIRFCKCARNSPGSISNAQPRSGFRQSDIARRRSIRILLTALVLTSAFLVAQEVPLKGPNRDPNPDVSRSENYQGCVIKSNGQVILTDSHNKDYILVRNARSQGAAWSTGETQSLESYVGQKVRITASAVNPSDPSLDDTSVSSQEAQDRPVTLDVETLAKSPAIAPHLSNEPRLCTPRS
jgi:hypothetical protein